jgi:2-dehydropantoate 2-reductase
VQVVVYGAGAIGCLVGARLHEAGLSVRLIGRPRQVDAISREGLRIETEKETRIVQIVAREHFEGAADVVLLTVKSQDVLESCRDIARTSLSATVVTMQNGVRSDAEAASILGRDRIVGCVVYLSSTYLQPGVIAPERWGGRLLVGAPYPESRSRVEAVREVLERAFPTTVALDLARARWTKLITNLPNAIPAATGLPFGRALRDARLSRLSVWAIREGVGIATAGGHALDNSPGARRLRMMAALPAGLAYLLSRRRLATQFPASSTFGGSTQQSLARGSSSELDYLNGEIVSTGRRIGRKTPVNGALLTRGQEVFRTRRVLTADELVAGLPL